MRCREVGNRRPWKGLLAELLNDSQLPDAPSHDHISGVKSADDECSWIWRGRGNPPASIDRGSGVSIPPILRGTASQLNEAG